jgi:hypothetical protein
MGSVIIPNLATAWYVPGIYINVELGRQPPSAAGQIRKVLIIGTSDLGEAEEGKLYPVTRLASKSTDPVAEPDMRSAEDLFGKDEDDPLATSLYWMAYAAFTANPLVSLYAVKVGTTETYAAVLSPIGGPICTRRFHYIVVEENTTSPGGAPEELGDYLRAQAMPEVGFRQQGIIGDAAPNCPSSGNPSYMDPRLQWVWSPQDEYTPSSPQEPYQPSKDGYYQFMLSASTAALRSRKESSDPAVNLCYEAVPGIPAPETLARKSELNDAIRLGWTPLVPSGSDVVILRSVTTAADASQNTYPVLDTTKVTVTDFVADNIQIKMLNRYKGFKLAPDTDIPPPSRTATPNGVKASLLEWLREHERAGQITLVTDLAERIKVEIADNDDGRLNFEVPEDVIGIFAVGAGNITQIG